MRSLIDGDMAFLFEGTHNEMNALKKILNCM